MWLSAYPVAFSKGNVVRSYISCVIFTTIMLWVATALAPVHTALAVSGGYELGKAVLVSTEDAGTHLLSYILSFNCRNFLDNKYLNRIDQIINTEKEIMDENYRCCCI